RFLYDNMYFTQPQYYSPQNLFQNQFGAEYAPKFEFVEPYIRFLPGFGHETNVTSGYIMDLEIGIPFKLVRDTTFGPYYQYSKTPTYWRDTYTGVFSHRFQ